MIYNLNTYGPTFGGGHDLMIHDRGNMNKLSTSYICNTYGNGNSQNKKE
jgi:hypothetical protein